MLRALLKKQFLEFGYAFTRNRKKKKGITGVMRGTSYGLLLLLAFFSLGFTFYILADSIGAPFFLVGFGWLFYALMGMIALMVGTLGSVFNTYSSLYLAKDNELLLSMPIPPRRILFVRMISVYLIALVYESIVMIPVLIVGWMNSQPTALQIICQIALVLGLGLVIEALTCFLGWLVAIVSVRLKNKSYLTVAFAIAFLAAYYYVYFKANELMSRLLENVDKVEQAVRTHLFPVYHFGLAAEGKIPSLLIFLGIALVLFAITWYAMSVSFLRLTTSNRGEKKKTYQTDEITRMLKSRSLKETLFQKELKRFTSNPTYMLNCGLGLLFLPLLGIFALIKQQTVRQIFSSFPLPHGMLLILAAAGIGMILNMNDITAPSVSLEGKSLWILQAFPLPGREILRSKQRLQIRLTLLPSVVVTAILAWVLKFSIVESLLLEAFVIALVFFYSALGLALNLKRPNLNWTNEAIPIKQSMVVFLMIFGGWGLMVVMGVLYYVLRDKIAAQLYLGLWVLVIGGLTALMDYWLDHKGASIFESL